MGARKNYEKDKGMDKLESEVVSMLQEQNPRKGRRPKKYPAKQRPLKTYRFHPDVTKAIEAERNRTGKNEVDILNDILIKHFKIKL